MVLVELTAHIPWNKWVGTRLDNQKPEVFTWVDPFWHEIIDGQKEISGVNNLLQAGGASLITNGDALNCQKSAIAILLFMKIAITFQATKHNICHR